MAAETIVPRSQSNMGAACYLMHNDCRAAVPISGTIPRPLSAYPSTYALTVCRAAARPGCC